MFNLFNDDLGIIKDEPTAPRIFPQISRDKEQARDNIRSLKKVCRPLGEVLEKCENINDSIENVVEAIYPITIVYHKITDKSVDEIVKKIGKGDHIAVQRTGYSHHGIYDGTGYVYEYINSIVHLVSLKTFANGDDLYIVDE